MKSAEIGLSYYKQGDDMSHALSETKNVVEALEYHAAMMDQTAAHLRKIKDMIGDSEVEIYGDTHFISITGPDDLIDKLLAAELVYPGFNDEEDEEWDDEEDEEWDEEWDDEQEVSDD